ncbi:MAG: alpha-L-fucosidase [Ginsengibacter sp.]
MKKTAACLSFFICSISFAQHYEPTWQSLDARPVPQWYTDAKFGIFIHWGVYSVPGWSTKGNYAEWYQYGLQTTDTARQSFHQKKFGDLTYYQLADQFKAELFNPDEWAKLFELSGAKYIVLTSKHHDGFCLWPNKEANRDWGFNWNAADAGPHRDLLGDLFNAVRKTSVHPGMYYSLYEWFNPLWKSDKNKYVSQHVWPQMKELINNYRPDVFWTDGDWEVSDDVWKAKEFLQWMYNESPVKDRVVTYDRWGSNIRFHHGLVFTPEYQPDVDFDNHYWEESRGMGRSYGYNREEDAWDYNSAQSLIIALIDKVSRGGNFLLDIGPDEHGKIPPIMQERLLQMGEWLSVNGESIYGSSRWKNPYQLSEGRLGYLLKKDEDPMLKLTVNPDSGYAVKNIFYTYNANKNILYAIFPKYPQDKLLLLKNTILPLDTKITFLSTGKELSWKQEGVNLAISLPEYDPNNFRSPYAFAVSIHNYGAYSTQPVIQMEYKKGSMLPVVTITGHGTIRYTTNHTDPGESSLIYTRPLNVKGSEMIKAKAFEPGKLQSSTASDSAIVYKWMDAVKVGSVSPGIAYKYFEPVGDITMASIDKAKIISSGVASSISPDQKKRKDKFAFEFTGYINIQQPGFHSFFIQSDDGSKLFIDDIEIVNNDGDHGMVEKSKRAALKKGLHRLKVLYYDSGGDNGLKVFIQQEGGRKQEISSNILFH